MAEISGPITRPDARVVILNGRDEVSLFHVEQEGEPEFGIVPGGGVEPGESFEDAARRELREETGIDVEQVGPCVWTGHLIWSWQGESYDSDNRYYLVRVEGVPDIDSSGLGVTEAEALDICGENRDSVVLVKQHLAGLSAPAC